MEPIPETLIREAARKPARVILFGSYARGEGDSESDLDFLVVQQDGFRATAGRSFGCRTL